MKKNNTLKSVKYKINLTEKIKSELNIYWVNQYRTNCSNTNKDVRLIIFF